MAIAKQSAIDTMVKVSWLIYFTILRNNAGIMKYPKKNQLPITITSLIIANIMSNDKIFFVVTIVDKMVNISMAIRSSNISIPKTTAVKRLLFKFNSSIALIIIVVDEIAIAEPKNKQSLNFHFINHPAKNPNMVTTIILIRPVIMAENPICFNLWKLKSKPSANIKNITPSSDNG